MSIDPWNTTALDEQIAQRARERQAALDDPLGTARTVLAAMTPGSPDSRDQAMGLYGIGLALVAIADALTTPAPQPPVAPGGEV